MGVGAKGLHPTKTHINFELLSIFANFACFYFKDAFAAAYSYYYYYYWFAGC